MNWCIPYLKVFGVICRSELTTQIAKKQPHLRSMALQVHNRTSWSVPRPWNALRNRRGSKVLSFIKWQFDFEYNDSINTFSRNDDSNVACLQCTVAPVQVWHLFRSYEIQMLYGKFAFSGIRYSQANRGWLTTLPMYLATKYGLLTQLRWHFARWVQQQPVYCLRCFQQSV